MPEIVDWQPREKPRRLNPFFYLLLAVVFIIFFGGSTAISYWVDLLWFSSLGYAGVFWRSFNLEWATFAVFALLTFFVLFAAFLALRRHHARDLPETHTIYIGSRPIFLPVEKALRVVAFIATIAVSLVTGFAMQSQWPTLALYWYAPHSAQAIADPIFGRPLGFYLFTLPAWQLISGWLFSLAIFVGILAVAFFIAAGSGRALEGRFGGSLPWRGVSVAAGFLLLALAIREYIGRFALLFNHHTIFDGITYVDAHVTVLGMACIGF